MPVGNASLETTKISDTEISVTKIPNTPIPVVTKYKYDFLISQKANIIKQANDYLATRQVELDEVNNLLAECDRLGITSSVMPAPLEEDK